MDYRFRYFIHYNLMWVLVLVIGITYSILIEIVSLRTLFVEFNLGVHPFVAFSAIIGVLGYSFLMSVFYAPFGAAPIKLIFRSDQDQLEEFEEILINVVKERQHVFSFFQRKKIVELDSSSRSYIAGNSYVDWLLTPIVWRYSSNIELSVPRHYAKAIKEACKSKGILIEELISP